MLHYTRPPLQKRSLLGFFTHPGTLDNYLGLIRDSINNREPCTVLYHNLHSLYSYFTSAALRQYYQGCTVLVDGMPLIWLYQAAGVPVTRDHRLTYVDFIMPMMQQARDQGWRVYHLGQSTEVQQLALAKLRQQFPGIEIDGHDGYFDQTPHSSESDDIIRRVNDFSTDLLLIGFGAPRQEAWVHAHREEINAPAVFTCGACMEYVAGAVKTPPRWMGRMGLEWSYRLIENPRRFAFRYLAEPLLLSAILARNWIVARITGRRADI
jgi:N-acetylglucosaminyldiphosphoundecaprenol N-acetyl-beta-D-mannosaminyltransferase